MGFVASAPVSLVASGCIVASRESRASARDEGAHLIRLGIVDDHPVFRLGLMRMLERENDLLVAWELGSVTGLDAAMETSPVDVVLMDLNLGPEQDALAATTSIRINHAVKVIVISASLDWEAASAARAAGASAFLPKDLEIADMVAAIRGLSSPNFGRWTFTDMLETRGTKGTMTSLRKGLSPREQQVLSELRRGRTNKEIASRLGVSITTINKHVQQVLKKLHVRTRAQAVAMVDAETYGGLYLQSGSR
jgi:DNA-binding NarL/FixJ family response regulator